MPVVDLFLFLGELWLIGGFVLFLHRISSRYGLSPLALCLGGMIAIMEFNATEWVQFNFGGLSFDLASHVLLPALLLGLLVVYIVNGTTRARVILTGLFLSTVLSALIQLLLALQLVLPGIQVKIDLSSNFSPRSLIASIVSLVIDLVLVILVYQAASNWQGQFPSRVGSILALLAALWSDALFYPLFAFGGDQGWLSGLAAHMVGKTLAGVLLAPLFVFYLTRIAPALPGSVASAQRPLLDLFKTTLELEARSHHRYRLLRIITSVNQLIMRIPHPEELLDQVCKLLIDGSDYQLAWIGLADESRSQIKKIAHAGGIPLLPDVYPVSQPVKSGEESPGRVAFTTGKAIFLADIAHGSSYPHYRKIASEKGYRCLAFFPMRQAGRAIGILCVCSARPSHDEQETVDLFQELADDLAFALVNLENRRQHAAIAIQNARLYEDIRRHTADLEDRVWERTAQLQAAKERIEGILASVPDAVFVQNELGELVHANAAGETLLAAARQENIELFASDPQDYQAGEGSPSEKNLLEVQGRTYQPLASSLAIDGGPAGRVLVFRDVTRFHELDVTKTQFVSDVSHELRTPLTNLTIYLDLMSSVQDPFKRRSYLDILKRETERLTHLIEDLLTIARLEAGRVDMAIQPVDINRLVSELAHDRVIMANKQGLSLTYELTPNLPPAMADVRLLGQAISNLLTNAINYTPGGGSISLGSGFLKEGEQTWVTVKIADSGVGISEQEKEHIFERFFRGSASSLTKAAGTGLGLPISREIVERMGGHITLESVPSQGSVFTVWLPAVL